MTYELTKTQQRRLKQMNRRLTPVYLEFRPDSGRFRFVLSQKGRIRKNLGKDLERAYEAALLLREKYLNGDPLISNRSITLGAWYDHLKPERKRKLAKTTWDIEKYYWAKFSDDIRNTPLNRLTQNDIDRELDEIEGPSQKDHTAVFIRTILNAAVKNGLIDKSPFQYNRQKGIKKQVPTLTPEQLVHLCHSVPDEARPACLLAAFFGLRRGEIMGLRYQDIKLSPDIMQIDVHSAKVSVDGDSGKEEYIVEPKAGSTRIVPIMPDLPSGVLEMMRSAFERHPPEDFVYSEFQSSIHKTIRQTCKRKNLPEIGLHDLRHICGTHWVINHGMAFASAALGHASIQMTIDVYADLNAIVEARRKIQPAQHSLTTPALQLANDLVNHPDPEVRELALLTLQICS